MAISISTVTVFPLEGRIRATFSSPLENNPALSTVGNYEVTGGPVETTISEVSPESGTESSYVDIFTSELKTGTSYTLTIYTISLAGEELTLVTAIASTVSFFSMSVVEEFMPTSIAGCVLWLRAASQSAVGDGNNVSPPWVDESDEVNSMAQLGTLPIFRATPTGFNGQPALDFTTGQQMAKTGATGVTSIRTAFAVIRGGDATGGPVLDYGQNAFTLDLLSGSTYTFYDTTNAGASQTVTPQPTILNETRVISWIKNDTGGTVNVWFDGITQTVDTITVFADIGTTLTVGRNTGSVPIATTHYIAEIIMYDSALSTPNRQAVESYLRDKYGTP